MKNLLSSVLLLIGLVAATACKKSDSTPSDPGLTIFGNLDGTQQVPMVTSTARGVITGTFDKASNTFKYTIIFSGLMPMGAHFHAGAPGVSGPIIIDLPKNNPAQDGYVSPIAGVYSLSPANAAALLSNGVYINLHTMAYPGGEIRANITVK